MTDSTRKPKSENEGCLLGMFFTLLLAVGIIIIMGVDRAERAKQARKPASPPVEKQPAPAPAASSTTARTSSPEATELSPAAKAGKQLVGQSDCLACHRQDSKLVGPSYREIAQKYAGDSEAPAMLADRIKQGGSGNWGNVAMTPHPQLSDSDLEKMVTYILELSSTSAQPSDEPVDISGLITAQPLIAHAVDANLFRAAPQAEFWSSVEPLTVTMEAQPMTVPRPTQTRTEQLQVQAVHNGERLALRLQWQDPERSVAGRQGTFSDAAAVQFPLSDSDIPPPVAMGSRDQPVHVIHWRTQFQMDKEEGMQSMEDIYPNMVVDMYPLEFAYAGSLDAITPHEREVFAVGQAVGNPQSFRKSAGLDEIVAEGFGSSSVIEDIESQAIGAWVDNRWTLVIVRPLVTRDASALKPGSDTYVGFAVWQGGSQEVGSRKSVTMKWTPFQIAEAE